MLPCGGKRLVLVAEEHDGPSGAGCVGTDCGDPIQHGALKVVLQHRTDRPRKSRVHRDREVERDDFPLLDQVCERRQGCAVAPVGVLLGIVGLLRWAERVFHLWVVVEQREEHADAFDDGGPKLRLDTHPIIFKPACPSRIPNSLVEYRAKATLRAADRVPYAVACMEAVVLTLLHLAVTAAKLCRPGGVRAVIAENLLLKQQLIVLRRPRQRAPNLTTVDRLLCGFGSLFLGPGRLRKVAIGVRPSTLLAFHRALVHRKYRRLFSSRHRPRTPGPKGPSAALIRAIVELKSRNPRFGCPRMARIISRTFGVDIDKNVVARVLAKHYRPAPGGSGPSWLSCIGHATDSPWSADLFRCESIVLQSYWVLVVMDQCTRRLVGFGVHHGSVDAPGLCRMFNAATHGQGAPRHLSTDHDPLFEAHRWQANLRLLEIDEIKTVPHVPLSHPFVERLIGTIRREFLDQVFFWNARDLQRKLADFQAYYNAARSHASLEGHTPFAVVSGYPVARADLNNIRWVSHCRDLVQLPAAA